MRFRRPFSFFSFTPFIEIENANRINTKLYVASIFYTSKGNAEAYEQLSSYAKKYPMHILMANYVGTSYRFQSGGQSAFWNKNGELIKQLNKEEENLLVIQI